MQMSSLASVSRLATPNHPTCTKKAPPRIGECAVSLLFADYLDAYVVSDVFFWMCVAFD